MKTGDLVSSAVGNTFRSRTRTALTVVAIVIGAFTLTLTSGVGTGINAYMDDTVAAIGAGDVMTVIKTVPDTSTGSGPQPYTPDSPARLQDDPGLGPPQEVEVIRPADVTALSTVDGVLSVAPTLDVHPDFVQHGGGAKFEAPVDGFVPGMTLELAAGAQPRWDAAQNQVALPKAFVEPLGYADPADAVGSIVTLGVTSAEGKADTVSATVVGVSEAGLVGGDTISLSNATTEALYDAQSVGLSAAERTSYSQAVLRFAPDATDADVAALKARLTALGYTGTTVEDRIGAFRTVIDAIVLVLNGFAVIALLAAGFGIVNTLLMSVQERTREIGLMKAVGMPGRSVFGLFSIEAVFIGLLGSAIGAGAAVLAGSIASGALASRLFADLPGLQIIAFDPVAILTIVVAVMGIAFLAGTVPALRAARQDPIDALRYE